jgi:membrane complex biogenesis BtpA family protein
MLQGRCPLLGVLHLLPLPGAVVDGPGFDAVLARAMADAHALAEGGAQAVIVENLGDAPFEETVEPHVVAMLAVIARQVRLAMGDRLKVGVNALRNDAMGALGAAAGAGADFVRVNVHTGVMVTDQGVIQGQARRALLYRKRVAPKVLLAADVMVKHASPLGAMDLAQAAHDTWHRGHADALIVTGAGTGRPTQPADLERVREAVPEARIWIGSGVTLESAPALGGLADAAIVGTALHHDSDLTAPLDVGRVRAMVHALADNSPS